MEIGKTRRVITIEPIESPVPAESPVIDEPAIAPAEEPVQAGA